MRWPGGGKGPSGRREEGANTSPSQKSKQVWSGCRVDVDVDVSGPSQIIMSTIRMMRPTNGRGESRGSSLLVRMHHRCNMIYVLRGSRAVVSLRLSGTCWLALTMMHIDTCNSSKPWSRPLLEAALYNCNTKVHA